MGHILNDPSLVGKSDMSRSFSGGIKLSCVMTHKGKILDLEDFFNVLMDYNVIFIGEEHESPIAHKAELTILTELAERDSSLVLALEMFERDVQDTLNAYLKGKIPEDEFLERTRPWPNYHEDYRPLTWTAASSFVAATFIRIITLGFPINFATTTLN